MSARVEYVAGLRMLADLLERHDDLPLPYSGDSPGRPLTIYYFGAGRDAFAAAARILPAPLRKSTTDATDGGPATFRLACALRGLHVEAIAYRDTVCVRVPTGTQTVTREVPDPAVVVPTVTVTEDVETFRWDCSPLLSDVDTPAVTG
jgi:hypothetical protein